MNIFPDSKIIFNTLLFLFLIHPPLILAEPEDTEQENKTAWPYPWEPCPFSDIGCKFVHNDLDPADMEIDVEDEYSLNENQCHLCREQLSSQDDLWNHVEVRLLPSNV